MDGWREWTKEIKKTIDHLRITVEPTRTAMKKIGVRATISTIHGSSMNGVLWRTKPETDRHTVYDMTHINFTR